MKNKTGILFIESGGTDGGSFGSLYQHLLVIDRGKYSPVVVYLNDTRFEDRVRELDIPVYILTSPIFSNHVPRPIRGAFLYLLALSEKLAPSSYIFFSRLVNNRLVNSLHRLVVKHDVRIVHLNDQISRDLFGIHLAERAKIPCISHLRSTRSLVFNERCAKYTNFIVDIYIANAMITYDYWVEKGLDAEKIRLIYNGIATDPTDPLDIRSIWNISDKTKYLIACAAPLLEEKGQRFLMRAFHRFSRRYPDSLLIIMGDGQARDEYVREASQLDIEDKVLFTGFQKQVKEILASVDVTVEPSVYDSFGRIVLETMLVGTPLIATDVGGIREMIRHEDNALLVEYGDEEGLAGAMERLLVDKKLRKKIVKNGHKTIEEKFSIDHYAEEVEKIYEEVLKGGVK